jgi:hypothetical protein
VAQIFTGLRGDDPGRAADVEVTLRLLDDLWDASVASEVFHAHNISLAAFPELTQFGGDVELIDSDEIFATYAIEILHYAASFRSTDDVGEALECAHMSLTLTDLMDQNNLTENSFDQESQKQQSDLAVVIDDEAEPDIAVGLRTRDRTIGRARYLAVR